MAVEDVSTRLCVRCDLAMPVNVFRIRNGKPFVWCKPCEKEYKAEHYKANKARVKQKSAQWRKDNPERYKAATRAYQARNKDRHTAQTKEWARKNPEARKRIWTKYREVNLDRARLNEAAYRARNRSICNARVNEWKRNNKELLAFYTQTRAAALIRATPIWANLDAVRRIYAEAHKLRQSTGDVYHVDHIVPLKGKTVCGLHCEANLQIIPGVENLRKNRHSWPDMP